MDEPKIELTYRVVSRWKRFFAFLLDSCLAIIVGLGLASGATSLARQLPVYSGNVETMMDIELESGLYVRDGNGGTVNLVENAGIIETSTEADYRLANSAFSTALDAFFASDLFFPEGNGEATYEDLKVGDKCIMVEIDSKTQPYFAENADGDLVPAFDEKTMYGFYVEAIEGTAIPYISTLEPYIEASRAVFLTMVIAIAISVLLALSIVFLIPPLFFRRGRQTLGLKAFRLAVLTPDAVPPSIRRTLARGSLLVLVELALSFFAFGLPFLTAATMFMVRRDRQSFHDYVTGTYVVDASEMPVFLSLEDYQKKTGASTPIDLVTPTNDMGRPKVSYHQGGEDGEEPGK